MYIFSTIEYCVIILGYDIRYVSDNILLNNGRGLGKKNNLSYLTDSKEALYSYICFHLQMSKFCESGLLLMAITFNTGLI